MWGQLNCLSEITVWLSSYLSGPRTGSEGPLEVVRSIEFSVLTYLVIYSQVSYGNTYDGRADMKLLTIFASTLRGELTYPSRINICGRKSETIMHRSRSPHYTSK